MCGEIEKWQVSKTFTIQLTTAQEKVKIPEQYQRVEEIRLDEQMFINFQGGVSGIAYLNMKIPNAEPSTRNNKNINGTALPVDVLTPHTIYQRPRVLVKSTGGTTISDFDVQIRDVNGDLVTFNTCLLVITVVMRKSSAELEEYRRMEALVTPPAIKGPDPRTTYLGDSVSSK